MSRVGEKIKSAREKSGLTQKALAKKLGVAEKYINEVELGRKVAQESFIDRAAKILNVDLNDINMVVTDEALMEERKQEEKIKKELKPKKQAKILGETSELWTEAFSSVLKTINIYDYNLKNAFGKKELPVYSNKVCGYPADKVLYIKVQDNEMAGFRIMKDDIAFGHLTKDLTGTSGIYLIEFEGKRVIRQVKSLGGSKILLIKNENTVQTVTTDIHSIRVVAKLESIEFNL